jgi:putative pantetheine hydrolase
MSGDRHDDLTDVPGIRVGHATRDTGGRRTGCTVIVPETSCAAGVDVRGGAPGTRETDLLDPRNLVDRVDAVVLSGGSAFGLRTADGVMDALAELGRGWPVGDGVVVPIVPAAILFDLDQGDSWRAHPTADDGRAALEEAMSAAGRGPIAQGRVGAGTGAMVARRSRPGGIGSASADLGDGLVVAALVAVNAIGTPVGSTAPDSPEAAPPTPGTATCIGVVATNATLTKAECSVLAKVAHDGLARAIDPVHTAFDGDTFFALATGELSAPGPEGAFALQAAVAACVTRAVAKAVAAQS